MDLKQNGWQIDTGSWELFHLDVNAATDLAVLKLGRKCIVGE